MIRPLFYRYELSRDVRFAGLVAAALLITGFLAPAAAVPQQIHQTPTTTEVTGRVVDAQTGVPIPAVNVFLSGTTIGTTTDSTGHYSFAAPHGSYELVASIIGYQTASTGLEPSPGDDRMQRDFRLTETVYEVEELRVSDTEDILWQHRFQRFRQQFIGDSRYARETNIENPYYLNFESNPMGTLTASARHPLTIVNRALGYKITFYLDSFAYNDRAGRLRYRGWTAFERLEPTSEAQAKEWKENRREAYRGSLEHLMRAAIADDLEEEGFYVKPLHSMSQGRTPLGFQAMQPERFLNPTDTSYVYKLSFDGTLRVIYVGSDSGDWELRFRSRRSQGAKQTSRLRMRRGAARVHQNGYLYDPLSLRLGGAMSYYRMAEALPANYSP